MDRRQRCSTETMANLPLLPLTMRKEFQKMIRIVIPLGCMSPAAIASPILFEYRSLWLIDLTVFFISTGVFVAQYIEEIKTYGPFTLSFATFLGFAAYSSARTPLRDLIPWIPMVVWMFVLLTVYFFPKAHGLLTRPVDPRNAMEEGRQYDFQMFPVGNGLPQPDFRIRSGNEDLALRNWLNLDVAGMDRRSAFGVLEGLSTHESDIDLQEHSEAVAVALRRGVSIGRAGFFNDGLSLSSSDGPNLQKIAHSVHSDHFRNSEDRPGSPSSDSVAVSVPPSTAVESAEPLLG